MDYTESYGVRRRSNRRGGLVLVLQLTGITHDVYDGSVDAVIEQSTAALYIAGSIPAPKQYLYDLQICSSWPECLCM